MSMTENEVFEGIHKDCGSLEICDYKKTGCGDCFIRQTLIKAEKALEEVQAYRAIGTVEGYKRAIEVSKENYYLCAEYKAKLKEYESVGTIDEFKALKEKNVAKKPRFYAHNYHCIECGNLVGNNEFEWQRFLYCDKCGTKIDWQ